MKIFNIFFPIFVEPATAKVGETLGSVEPLQIFHNFRDSVLHCSYESPDKKVECPHRFILV